MAIGSAHTEREGYEAALAAAHERPVPFTTVSGRPILPLYVPDEPSEQHDENIGYPGQFPFTRGVHANLYRGRLWTMRQFAGFGTAGRDESAVQVPAWRRGRPG